MAIGRLTGSRNGRLELADVAADTRRADCSDARATRQNDRGRRGLEDCFEGPARKSASFCAPGSARSAAGALRTSYYFLSQGDGAESGFTWVAFEPWPRLL